MNESLELSFRPEFEETSYRWLVKYVCPNAVKGGFKALEACTSIKREFTAPSQEKALSKAQSYTVTCKHGEMIPSGLPQFA